MLYHDVDGAWIPWVGEAIAGIRHPLSIESSWSVEDLAAIGLHAPAPATAIAEGMVATGTTVARVDGVVRYVAISRAETVEETKGRYAAAVQTLIDATAKARGYDSGLSCVSYVDDPDTTYAAEAAAFKAWRSTLWASVIAIMTAVEAGTETAPTVDALLVALPAISWPD